MNEESVVAPRDMGQFERVVNTFIAPSSTFTDILRSTSWWLPFLLMALATLAVAFTIDRKVGFDQVVETQIHLSPSQESQMASLTPEDKAVRMHGMIIGYRISTYATPVIVLAVSALGSLLLWATLNFGLGSRSTYAQILCLWMFAGLPRLFAAFVTIITLCFGSSPENFNLRDPVGTNLGYYLPDAAPWLRAFLGFFDIIGLWVLFLLILGGAIVAKVKVGQAAAVVIGWWLLIMLVTVAATAAFS